MTKQNVLLFGVNHSSEIDYIVQPMFRLDLNIITASEKVVNGVFNLISTRTARIVQ